MTRTIEGTVVMKQPQRAVSTSRGAGKSHQPSYAEIVESKSLWYYFWKRFFDVTLSLIALVVLSPVFLITAILIVKEDGFPVFFSQERRGWKGNRFRIYKFRSMCRNASAMHESLLKYNEVDGPVFKIKEDPRVTKIGRFIRRTSIDELPQLWNIIKGDMSIVGPRPLVIKEADQCTEYQNQRLLVKPGLTCYWQCGGRNDLDFEQWMELDLKYIRDMSLWTDFKLILKTIVAVFREDGAY